MHKHLQAIRNQDETVMRLNIGVLQELQIPSLWKQGRFSAVSRKHLWTYLDLLTQSAADFHTEKNISPPVPDFTGLLPQLSTIAQSIPEGVQKQVNQVAEKYNTEIEQGKMDASDLPIGEISKDLFSRIDPQDLAQMMESVGSLAKAAFADPKMRGNMSALMNMIQ
jgi:hypothetical protein